MNTFHAVKSGNWSDKTVWEECRVPTRGSNIDLQGNSVILRPNLWQRILSRLGIYAVKINSIDASKCNSIGLLLEGRIKILIGNIYGPTRPFLLSKESYGVLVPIEDEFRDGKHLLDKDET